MREKFPYEKEVSKLFGVIKRPVALAYCWSQRIPHYLKVYFIVDTGADYTLFPFSKAYDFGINLEKDCKKFKTYGIGGEETVFLCPEFKIKLCGKELFLPVGFLKRDDIPPLLGRHKCLDEFSVLFSDFITTFEC